MHKFPKILKLKINRYDSQSLRLSDEQLVCVHVWERMLESQYSHCKKCMLMRHDVDGDLINPLVYR